MPMDIVYLLSTLYLNMKNIRQNTTLEIRNTYDDVPLERIVYSKNQYRPNNERRQAVVTELQKTFTEENFHRSIRNVYLKNNSHPNQTRRDKIYLFIVIYHTLDVTSYLYNAKSRGLLQFPLFVHRVNCQKKHAEGMLTSSLVVAKGLFYCAFPTYNITPIKLLNTS